MPGLRQITARPLSRWLALIVLHGVVPAQLCFASGPQAPPPPRPNGALPARTADRLPVPWTMESIQSLRSISIQPLVQFERFRPGLSESAFQGILARLRPPVSDEGRAELTLRWREHDTTMRERYAVEATRLLAKAQELSAIEAADPWTASFMDKVIAHAESLAQFAESTESDALTLLDAVTAARQGATGFAPSDRLILAQAKERVVLGREGIAKVQRSLAGVGFSPYAELPAEGDDDTLRSLGESADRYVADITPLRQSLVRGLVKADAGIRFLQSNDEKLQRRVRTMAASAFSAETLRAIRDRTQQAIGEIGALLGPNVESRIQREFDRASFPDVDPMITKGEEFDRLVTERRTAAWKAFDAAVAPIQTDYASRLAASAATLRERSLATTFAQYSPVGGATMPEYNDRFEALQAGIAAHATLIDEYRAALLAVVPEADLPPSEAPKKSAPPASVTPRGDEHLLK